MELRLLRWVKPGDVVNFDGATLTPEKKSFLLINKPKNFTTAMDEGQNFVMFRISKVKQLRIGAIGRMDKNTTGLLVFTNDTDMIRKFTLPKKSSIYHFT
jgi:23S rRNA pseudouridine2605 synthase